MFKNKNIHSYLTEASLSSSIIYSALTLLFSGLSFVFFILGYGPCFWGCSDEKWASLIPLQIGLLLTLSTTSFFTVKAFISISSQLSLFAPKKLSITKILILYILLLPLCFYIILKLITT